LVVVKTAVTVALSTAFPPERMVPPIDDVVTCANEIVAEKATIIQSANFFINLEIS
jgi:hypothetical protein